MHLEGALTPEILFELAKKNNVSLPKDDPAFASIDSLLKRYGQFTSLDDFLQYYYIGMSVLIQSSDFEALAWDYFQHASADGVVHAEVFFDPQAHVSRGVTYETILSGFMAARARAEKELGITSELICCFLRHLPPAECVEMIGDEQLHASARRGDIIGVGLDSSELNFPPELFTELYEKAGALGLRRTAHAGEEGPAAFVKSALDVLKVERIDHGIRVADDPVLLKRVAEEKILLTVCPLSNVLLQCVKSVAELPIRKFLDLGVQFSINSDDPAYFGNNYLLNNYCAVQDAFDLSVNEWATICEAGIRGSWCSAQRKDEMLSKLKSVIEGWKSAH